MSSKLIVPLSVVIAGVLIAGAIVYSNGAQSGSQAAVTAGIRQDQSPDELNTVGPLREVNDTDWRRGPENAPITIIEYSDFECPFCAQFHDTMKNIRAEYPNDVAWVWRHFPIEQLHSKAPREAEAAECVGSLGGNEAFWTFADRIYEVSPMNNGFNLSELPAIAEYAGVDPAQFQQCLDSGEFAQAVEDDLTDAESAGSNIPRLGTPFSVIISGDQRIPLVGAQPQETVSQIIDELRTEE